MLPSLSAIAAAQQSKPTTATVQRTDQFLDYAASQEPAVLTYRKSGMVYAFHSNAAYLNESNARSRAGGHIFSVKMSRIPQTTVQFIHLQK
jgi:hypothetical protein